MIDDKLYCPLLGYEIYEQTCKSCHYNKYWHSLACHDLRESALLGVFLNRWEVMLDELKTINEIKDLAHKIKDKIPPGWNEKFIEVEA